MKIEVFSGAKEIINEYLPYTVGALLYVPCINENLLSRILNRSEEGVPSMALCLEDSVHDSALPEAQRNLKNTLAVLKDKENICKLFVRVRNHEHLLHIHSYLEEYEDALTGYILPKFDMSNAEKYKEAIVEINKNKKNPLYFMPILESAPVARLETRKNELLGIKKILDSIKEYVLNVRVGGNDFCNLYGVRRSINQTIYDIGIIRNIFVDILNVFSTDYVVSGPVWEYFGTDLTGSWAKGIERELELDRLNGFIGKTCIHPSQVQFVKESLKVSRTDYDDAKHILDWKNEEYDVEAGVEKNRMNEVKCHLNWAKKTYVLGKIYGIKED